MDNYMYESLGCLHEWFSRDCKKFYEQPAVFFEGLTQTYFQLDKNSSLLASWLQKKAMVQVGDLVAIYLPKSLSYPTAYIGILKAGGGYLPLETSYPEALLKNVLEDAQPKSIITSEKLANEKLQEAIEASGVKTEVFIIDDEGFWRDDLQNTSPTGSGDSVQSFDWQPKKMSLDDLAYAVYSSGTTGKPKGIKCPHRGAVFSYNWRHIHYPYEENEREACNVFFVWEMLRPLLKGATLYIIPETVIYDPKQLILYLEKHKITRMLATPSLVEAILNAKNIPSMDALSLKILYLCGEVVTTKLREQILETVPKAQLVNVYSVSECHDVAVENLTTWKPPVGKERKYCPVGQLLEGGVVVAILDDKMNLQPVGVAGEIYVGGPTLAIGYLNREELTRERFVDRPANIPKSFGNKLYRTGDWGYLLANNVLEICGRCDSMVKMRGYSIELKAVETALTKLQMVDNCVVEIRGNEGDDKFLVAYVVLKKSFVSEDMEQKEGGMAPIKLKKEIKSKLKALLPFYMIPSVFYFMDQLPVMESSAKLDKKKLAMCKVPNTRRSASHSSSIDFEDDPECMPSTLTEKKLHKIWKKALRLRSVDVTESFFDLGGHSLAASHMLEMVYEQLNIEIRVQQLFEFPTIVQLAKLIDNRKCGISTCKEEQDELDLEEEVSKYNQIDQNFDIQLRAFWRSFALLDTKWRRANILLTGSTGFLGSFVLQELLLKTHCYIFCTVREIANTASVEYRLREKLKQAHILAEPNTQSTEKQELAAAAFDSRVSVIKADVSLDQLGVDEETYNMLLYEVDIIIHSAAQVNLIYPYAALRRANVFGTVNMIKLAATSKIKPLHYLSTNAVFPAKPGKTYKEDTSLDSFPTELKEGYAQSKWVAEQLVTKARDRGLPVVIYRPGNIGGDSNNCFWNPQDMNLAILQAITSTNAAPDIEWFLELTPVDFIAQFIVACIKDIRAVQGKNFNLVQPNALDNSTLYKWMQNYGYNLNVQSLPKWLSEVQKSDSNKLKQSAKNLVKELGMTESLFDLERAKFDNYYTSEALKTLGLAAYPRIDNELLGHCFEKLIQCNQLERPQKTLRFATPMNSLDGKVAVVTGASSGFGRAIALVLGEHGAKLAVAARRQEKLDQLVAELQDKGIEAVAVKTDVSKLQEVEELHRKVELSLGPVDILVNNAGYMFYTEMHKQAYKEWEKTISANIWGATNCIGVILPSMIKGGKGGHIVNMSSDAGKRGFGGLAVYSGTKFYIEGLSQSLRVEVAKHRIKVTCIEPGNAETELLNHSTDMGARKQYDSTIAGDAVILSAKDVANAVLYAVTQPEHVSIGELLIQPTAEAF